MHALDESDLLLDLLREAGDEPVTLDELHVVGVGEPARALLALELAGHSVHRVYESSRPGHNVTCVRLGAPRPDQVPQPVAPIAPAAPGDRPPAARTGGPELRVLLVAVLAMLALVFLARRD